MKPRELQNLGILKKEHLVLAQQTCQQAAAGGLDKRAIRTLITETVANPELFEEHPVAGSLAKALAPRRRNPEAYARPEPAPVTTWGGDIDDEAREQIYQACKLPISARAALMPDAHVGYGLPIGGVLATRNAVIPYAVGVDIACRVMVSVLDIPVRELKKKHSSFERAIEAETRFGKGAHFESRREHEVMDRDWNLTPLVRGLKDLAWNQLGTSGSGNHFVEFGELELSSSIEDTPTGTYVALVSHSGSRGAGSQIALHYSDRAMRRHPDLPRDLRHLAWLSMDEDGAEYWAAMELMGHYASANHHLIHRQVTKAVGARIIAQVENHHNFAWKEVHDGEELIVHRKGATPASLGVKGYIPGTMAHPGYLVEGLGEKSSLESAAHGAGRTLSRKRAKSTTTRHALNKTLEAAGVTLLSAGLDESPHAYKNIDEVMHAQRSLVRPIGRFLPRIVKMAPEGEKPED